MHDKILILDFGSQVTQLIARRVREAHVYCEIHPNDVSDDFIAALRPRASSSAAATPAPTKTTSCARRRRCGTLGVPVLGICYGMFTMAVQLGGQVEGATTASSATPRCAPTATPAARRHRGLRTRRRPRHAQGVDEPRRQGHGAAAGLQADGQHAQLPDRRHGRRARGYYACSSTPRSRTPCRAGHADALRARDRRLRGRLDHGRLHRRGGGAHPRAGGRRRGDPRPVGRRGFQRGRGADPPRHRRPADLRLRRPRPAAPERRRDGDGDVRRQAARQGDPCRRQRSSWASCRRDRPRAKRKIIGREFVEVFQAEAAKLKAVASGPRAQVAGPGHHLPRRDRKRRRQDQEGHHHQEPPQRGRPARAPWA
jgi:GMP synthase-like glutamine amidotransferase